MPVLDYVKSIFAKLSELKPITITILIALIAAFIAYIVLSKKQSKKYNTKVIVYAGLSIAISFVLSYLRLYRWPQGGSITPAACYPYLSLLTFWSQGRDYCRCCLWSSQSYSRPFCSTLGTASTRLYLCLCSPWYCRLF